eukprot:GHRR01023503.1.p1 GENE.GHRR01023503.1~~GHRR01023503.1.p1  ORF type:complete len:112 (+),score=11.29 GHRR01023503.1:1735-2070(+)
MLDQLCCKVVPGLLGPHAHNLVVWGALSCPDKLLMNGGFCGWEHCVMTSPHAGHLANRFIKQSCDYPILALAHVFNVPQMQVLLLPVLCRLEFAASLAHSDVLQPSQAQKP